MTKHLFSFSLATIRPIWEASRFIAITVIKPLSSKVQKQNAVERLKQNKVACQHVLNKTTEITQVPSVINGYTVKCV